MNLRTAFITDFQPLEPVEPAQGAFNDPTVTPQRAARLDATASNARCDAPCPARLAAPQEVIAFVGVQFEWASARPTRTTVPNALHSIESSFKHAAVVHVRGGDDHAEGNAKTVNDEVAFAAELASVGGVAAGVLSTTG